MAAAQGPVAQGDVCPDPSVHEHARAQSRLQDQASKAALYVTHPERETEPPEPIPALGPDGKLSSAGAAASLKHAQPHELPSFPVVGIDTSTSGNKAANLAHKNQQPFEHWKPGDLSSSAGKAALMAHKDGPKLNLWQPTPSDPGHTAAGAAMRGQSGLSPQIDYGYTDDGRKKALMAATLSVKGGRGRSGSTPTAYTAPRYPDAENSAANALNAASVAHKPTLKRDQSPYRVSSPANEAARITHMQGNIDRDMFTEHPPISVESEQERKRKAALKGASLAHTQRAESAAAEAQRNPDANVDPMLYAKNYLNVQEQAQQLAQERLSKLDPDGARAYRAHYGYGGDSKRSRLSIRNRRTRSSSEGNERKSEGGEEDDARRAGRIRHQMSRFNDQLADVDAKKRQNDRSALMAAAEKSVKQRMSTMDQQIFDETGKVTPSVMEQWEAKARARAAEQSEKRLENHGMVNIGGGKFMDEKDVEAIAASRMQPTLDEIGANAEKKRARDEEIRLDQERRRDEEAKEKERNRMNKAEAKQAKKEEKELAKTQKRLHKEEQRQHKEAIKEQDDKAHDKAVSEPPPKSPASPTSPETAETATSPSTEKTEETAGGTTAAESAAAGTAGAGAGAAPVEKSTATEDPTPDAPKESKKLVSQKLTKGERSAMGATTADPPGVPTTFSGEKSAPHKSVKPDTEPAETQTASGPADVSFKRNSKRDSRVRSWLGKLKRGGKHERTGSGESQSTARSKRSEDAVGKEGKASGESGLYSHFKEGDEEKDMMSGGKGKGKEKEKERSISPPTPAARDSAEMARGRGQRESMRSDDDEFEEAKDKFDEQDLKLPEMGARHSGGDSSPARTSSKFMEEL